MTARTRQFDPQWDKVVYTVTSMVAVLAICICIGIRNIHTLFLILAHHFAAHSAKIYAAFAPDIAHRTPDFVVPMTMSMFSSTLTWWIIHSTYVGNPRSLAFSGELRALFWSALFFDAFTTILPLARLLVKDPDEKKALQYINRRICVFSGLTLPMLLFYVTFPDNVSAELYFS